MVLRVVFFIKMTFMWLQTGLSDLKNTKQFEVLLTVDFHAFLKMFHILNFLEIF